MHIKTLFLSILILLQFGPSHGQESRLQYVGFESGMNFIEGEISDMDFVRGNIPAYSTGYTTDYLTNLSYRIYTGAKYEITALNDRFSFATGLRYSWLFNSIGRNEYWTPNPGYFYVLYRVEGTQTEFMRVKEIRQSSNYLGMPFEIRYFMGRRPHLLQLYFKAGMEMNLLVHTHTSVTFQDEEMQKYEQGVSEKVEQPGFFYSSFYLAGGIRVGYDHKPHVTMEGCFPYLVLNPSSGGMMHPMFGGGFELNLHIPLKY